MKMGTDDKPSDADVKDEIDPKDSKDTATTDDTKDDAEPKYPDDVKAIIEKARMQERKRAKEVTKSLEDQLKVLKQNNSLLNEKLEKTNQRIAELDKKPEDTKTIAEKKESVDLEKLAESISLKLQSKHDEELKIMRERTEALERENRKMTLKQYKQSKIEEAKAAGTEIFDEVFTDDPQTEEDIDIAILKCKKISEKMGIKKPKSSPPPGGGKGTFSRNEPGMGSDREADMDIDIASAPDPLKDPKGYAAWRAKNAKTIKTLNPYKGPM